MNTYDPLDTELKQALDSKVPFSPADMARLNHTVVQAFNERQRKVKWVMTGYLAALLAGIIVLLIVFFQTPDLKHCLLLVVGIMVLYEGTVLIKLWFWVLHSKLSTLREIKQLQVQVADLAARLENRKP